MGEEEVLIKKRFRLSHCPTPARQLRPLSRIMGVRNRYTLLIRSCMGIKNADTKYVRRSPATLIN